MSYAFLKRLTAVALPVALLVATFAALHRVQFLSAAQRELTCYAPYLALSGGAALSLAFNRGRALLAMLLVGLFYLATRGYLLQGTASFIPHTIYVLSSILIPLDLFLFCFMRERGVFTHAGRLRVAFLCLQVALVVWIVRYPRDYGALPDLLGYPLFRAKFLEGIALPQSGLFMFVLAGTLITLRALKRHYPIDLALLGTLVALGIALDRIGAEFVPPLFVTAAALILTIGVLQDSHSMAFSDELTGLPSRRVLNEQVMGLGRRYVVAMVDVDHFKRFNDTHGHDVGDQVLKMVGSKLAAVRGGGKPYRYGGEEFAVIFPRKSLKEAVPYLEELRQSIGNYELSIRGTDRPKEHEAGRARRIGGYTGGKVVTVTVSIGVAASGDEMRSPAEVIQAADRALYRAKQRGRNQVAS